MSVQKKWSWQKPKSIMTKINLNVYELNKRYYDKWLFVEVDMSRLICRLMGCRGEKQIDFIDII